MLFLNILQICLVLSEFQGPYIRLSDSQVASSVMQTVGSTLKAPPVFFFSGAGKHLDGLNLPVSTQWHANFGDEDPFAFQCIVGLMEYMKEMEHMELLEEN